MSLSYAVLLGIIQGITEFLPISSTAHLTIAGKVLGLIDPSHPEEWTAFIAIMQLGTVAAVMIYFSGDVISMIRAFLRDWNYTSPGVKRQWSVESRLLGIIIVGTLPVAIIGVAFKHIIEGTFTKELSTIASSLIVLALILLWAERAGKRTRSVEQTTIIDGIIIGFAQACALIPGSSRSGTTITAGLFRGLTREAAARFSFLLSIPAVLASGFFELYEARHHLSGLGITPLIVSTLIAGIVGYAAIAYLLRYLRTHSTAVFIVYRIVLGGVIWALILSKNPWFA
jgi:undecaprenyl-diphosphatase